MGSFDELRSTPLAAGVSALYWPRTLPGNFAEVVGLLEEHAGIVAVDEGRLAALDAGPEGRAAIRVLLEDLRQLRELDLDAELNCIRDYARDERPGPVRTDVFSFHVDRAPVETDTWLCTYHGPPSEGLLHEHSQRLVDVPAIRAELLTHFGGEDDASFRDYLIENSYDLHYAATPQARPFSFGVGSLWRVATAWPGSPVPPFLHRAPQPQPGQPPRLLLIC